MVVEGTVEGGEGLRQRIHKDGAARHFDDLNGGNGRLSPGLDHHASREDDRFPGIHLRKLWK